MIMASNHLKVYSSVYLIFSLNVLHPKMEMSNEEKVQETLIWEITLDLLSMSFKYFFIALWYIHAYVCMYMYSYLEKKSPSRQLIHYCRPKKSKSAMKMQKITPKIKKKVALMTYYIQGVQAFLFQSNALIPCLLDSNSSLEEISVCSHSYWLVIFWMTNSSQVLAREKVCGKILKIFGKKN